MMSGGGVFRLQGVLRCLEVEYSGYRGVLLGCLEWNGCPTRMFGVFRQNILLSYIFSYMHQMDVEILNSDLAHTQLQCASIELHFSSENLLEANQILTHYRGESNSLSLSISWHPILPWGMLLNRKRKQWSQFELPYTEMVKSETTTVRLACGPNFCLKQPMVESEKIRIHSMLKENC